MARPLLAQGRQIRPSQVRSGDGTFSPAGLSRTAKDGPAHLSLLSLVLLLRQGCQAAAPALLAEPVTAFASLFLSES